MLTARWVNAKSSLGGATRRHAPLPHASPPPTSPPSRIVGSPREHPRAMRRRRRCRKWSSTGSGPGWEHRLSGCRTTWWASCCSAKARAASSPSRMGPFVTILDQSSEETMTALQRRRRRAIGDCIVCGVPTSLYKTRLEHSKHNRGSSHTHRTLRADPPSEQQVHSKVSLRRGVNAV